MAEREEMREEMTSGEVGSAPWREGNDLRRRRRLSKADSACTGAWFSFKRMAFDSLGIFPNTNLNRRRAHDLPMLRPLTEGESRSGVKRMKSSGIAQEKEKKEKMMDRSDRGVGSSLFLILHDL